MVTPRYRGITTLIRKIVGDDTSKSPYLQPKKFRGYLLKKITFDRHPLESPVIHAGKHVACTLSLELGYQT
jgi:hypothetical protein